MNEKRLYQDLSWLWPLWGDPDGDYAVWCARVTALIRQHARREDGKLRIEPDMHRLGLFSLDTWRAALRDAGFEVHADPDPDRDGGVTFVCVKSLTGSPSD
ncbi:MAG: hypothetical protein JXA21_22075 [Anaerolineae bacterium]|nr:hypothetical protein [Anaerolineae bacterium]